MDVSRIIWASMLAAGLVALAGYFAARQRRTLRAFQQSDSAQNPVDRDFLRKQARRRLWCSALLIVLAGLIVGWLFIEAGEPPRSPDQQRPTPEQEAYAWRAALYLTGTLLVVFAIIVLAVLDMGAISRFAHRKQRQLDADRQALLEDHLARFRKDRNGEA